MFLGFDGTFQACSRLLTEPGRQREAGSVSVAKEAVPAAYWSG